MTVIFFEYIVLKFKKILLYLHCQSTKHQYMPRQERTKSGTGIYHVMLRGINKQDMFEDDEDYLQMTSIKTKMITEPSLGHFQAAIVINNETITEIITAKIREKEEPSILKNRRKKVIK